MTPSRMNYIVLYILGMTRNCQKIHSKPLRPVLVTPVLLALLALLVLLVLLYY